MSYRTNPDRILDNIDRARNRAAEAAGLYVERQAVGRELDTEMARRRLATTHGKDEEDLRHTRARL